MNERGDGIGKHLRGGRLWNDCVNVCELLQFIAREDDLEMEKSSHWWQNVVQSIYTAGLAGELLHVTVHYHVLVQ